MILYYVERVGVYSQGIYGIFDSEVKAELAMIKAARKERDDYHNFCITARELNKEGYENFIMSKDGYKKDGIIRYGKKRFRFKNFKNLKDIV